MRISRRGQYSLRPSKHAILGWNRCPRKHAILESQAYERVKSSGFGAVVRVCGSHRLKKSPPSPQRNHTSPISSSSTRRTPSVSPPVASPIYRAGAASPRPCRISLPLLHPTASPPPSPATSPSSPSPSRDGRISTPPFPHAGELGRPG
jgi:hypothetical protein